VSLVDGVGPAGALTDTITLGIIAGLLLGKPLGVLAGAWLLQRFTRAHLADGLCWWDVLGLSLLSGIGITVSLLIGELAFGTGTVARRPREDRCFRRLVAGRPRRHHRAEDRNARYRRLCAEEERDDDHDGIPDSYQHVDDPTSPGSVEGGLPPGPEATDLR
jgi:NhaA family Na+:H+ antiporter